MARTLLRAARPLAAGALLLALPALSSAQTRGRTADLFTTGQGAERMSAQATEALASIQRNPMTPEPRLVRIAQAATLAGIQSLRIQIAPGQTITVDRTRLDFQRPGVFGWFGETTTPEGHLYMAELHVSQGRVLGTVTVDNETYQIVNLTGAEHALSRMDASKAPRMLPDMPEEGSAGKAGDEMRGSALQATTLPPPPYADCASRPFGCQVRVLVLYTAGAVSEVPNLQDVITAAMSEANSTYQRSGIPGLNVVEAGRVQVSYQEGGPEQYSTDRIQADLADVKILFPSLRDQYKADVVVMMTSNAYTEPGWIVAGSVSSREVNSINFPVIVVAKYATNPQGLGYTFAHELGHVYGAQHDPSHAGIQNYYPFEYGHHFSYKPSIFVGRRYWRTVMAYEMPSNNYKQIANFSNPNVVHDHRPTGVAGQNDNAQVLRLNGYAVSQYRADPLTASISGSPGPPPNTQQTYFASTNAPSANLTYQWELTTDPTGSFFWNVGTGASVDLNFSPNSDYILRLTVSDGTETAVSYLYITPYPDVPCNDPTIPCSGNVDAPVLASEGVVALSPNPARHSSTLTLRLEKRGNVSVSVLDVLGREVYALPAQALEAGRQQLVLDLGRLASGSYVVRVVADDRVQTHRLVLAR